MKLRGISARWLFTSLGATALLFLVLSSVILTISYSYYRNYVSDRLTGNANDSVAAYFAPYLNGTDESFTAASRQFVEDFEDKDLMDVWVFNRDGKLAASTTGFLSDVSAYNYDDVNQALSSKTGIAQWTGVNANGENIMAVTMVFPSTDKEFKGCVRFVTSLEEIGIRVAFIAVLILFAMCACLLLVYISGRFFIRSLVRPVRTISETANRIAKGDLNVELDTTDLNGEIGDLSMAINNMIYELRQSEKLKNDFISTVSHELRTPLTAIKGWGETLIEVSQTDKDLTKRGIEVIINESDRLSGMLEDLLDFSRLQTGTLSLRLEKIDVLAELDEAIFAFRERAKREGITLLYTATDTPTPMQGDADRIKQVFVNILDNAIKYTEQGGTIEVIASIVDSKAVISFKDTGCGIDPKDLPRITEKFFKSNVSVRGSGIGLAVTDEIVKRHEGTLQFESELGVGTTVTVTLPINLPSLPEERLS